MELLLRPRPRTCPTSTEGEFGYGDVWTWTAIDADTKLVPSWLVGERTPADCYTFLADLKSRLKPTASNSLPMASRITRPSRTRYGATLDFAQLIKIYAGPEILSSGTAPPNALGPTFGSWR